jgi:hypothetical protein
MGERDPQPDRLLGQPTTRASWARTAPEANPQGVSPAAPRSSFLLWDPSASRPALSRAGTPRRRRGTFTMARLHARPGLRGGGLTSANAGASIDQSDGPRRCGGSDRSTVRTRTESEVKTAGKGASACQFPQTPSITAAMSTATMTSNATEPDFGIKGTTSSGGRQLKRKRV